MEKNIFKNINQNSSTVTTRTWVFLTEWTRTLKSIGTRMKKWWWFQLVWMVDVVLQGAWVLYPINKDEGNESLPLLGFPRHVVNAIFLKYSKEGRLSSSHLGIRNILSMFAIYHILLHKTLPGAIWTQTYSEPLQTSKKECFCVKVNSLKSLTVYAKILHLRCLKGFWIHLCWNTRHVQGVKKELSTQLREI